mmetsp:Transcript_74368/g.134024  ORF Transcript_74368/g.134024 Transcript_74368/m.134024 type:complete len:257 (-) Transcript_74368:292-1062(-)
MGDLGDAVEALGDELEDIVWLTSAINLKNRVLEIRRDAVNLRMVVAESNTDGFLLVVAAVHQAIHDVRRWGPELQVVDLPILRVQAATAAALHERLVRDLDQQEPLDVDASFHQSQGLVWSPRETVQQTAFLLHVVLGESVLHKVDNEVAWHQRTRVHERLCLDAKRSSILDVLPQDVASGDVNVAIFLLDLLALGALTSRWWSGDHHDGALGAATTGCASGPAATPLHRLQAMTAGTQTNSSGRSERQGNAGRPN